MVSCPSELVLFLSYRYKRPKHHCVGHHSWQQAAWWWLLLIKFDSGKKLYLGYHSTLTCPDTRVKTRLFHGVTKAYVSTMQAAFFTACKALLKSTDPSKRISSKTDESRFQNGVIWKCFWLISRRNYCLSRVVLHSLATRRKIFTLTFFLNITTIYMLDFKNDIVTSDHS